jgi:putative transposase
MAVHSPTDPPVPLTPEALFRYQVVSQVRARVLGGETLASAVGAVAAKRQFDPASGEARKVSKRSVYRWVAAYVEGDCGALEPVPRRATASRVLPAGLLSFARDEKALDARASVPELIRRARELGIVPVEAKIDRSTLWRACRRLGLPLRRVHAQRDTDMRRFAYPHRMMMTLADGKHFRAGSRFTRRVALFFLDDATRHGLDVVVGTSESTSLFLRGLHLVVQRFGLMDIVFLDNGPGFISGDTITVVAALPSLLIHGTEAYPEGHGKIERFNQTALDQLLRSLSGAPDVDDDCGALELRLRHFLHRQYNQRPHESLDSRAPAARWDADERPLRFHAGGEEELRTKFVVTEERSVSKDNVLPFDGVDYEVPRGHAGERLLVHHQLLDGAVLVQHEGRFVRLHPVDLAANAAARRARPRPPPDASPAPGQPGGPPPARSAATLAFARDFGPLVGPDGGFPAAPHPDDRGDTTCETTPVPPTRRTT